jgi:ABC-type Na+ efflux pump permease subunit
MAFSSVMVLCGKNGTAHSSRSFCSTTTLILTAIFCLIALLSMIIYYRPAHGKYALLLAIPGIASMIFSVTELGGMPLYYSGALLVMAGLIRYSGLWFWVQRKFTVRRNLRTHYINIKFS